MTIISDKCYIGIDISKSTLDLHILPSGKCMQFKNEPKDISKLVKKFASSPHTLFVMEATGGYEKPLAYALQMAGLNSSIVNPRPIRDFAKALGKLAKTDCIDAKIIALYAQKIEPKPNPIYDKSQQELAELSARRRQLVDMITMEKNRTDKVSNKINRSIQFILKSLQKELVAINLAIHDLIQNDPGYATKNTILKSMKGIGPVIAANLLANLPELGTLGPKQITALAGLAPYNRDSGKFRGTRSIWGGRASVRSTLYMGTVVAIRHNPQIKRFYERLCHAGKKKKVALIACMHKMLIIMNTMLKKGEPWDLATTMKI